MVKDLELLELHETPDDADRSSQASLPLASAPQRDGPPRHWIQLGSAIAARYRLPLHPAKPLIHESRPDLFEKKWARYRGKESSACQEHFNDLCRFLGQPTPAEADRSSLQNFDACASKFCSSDFFCFQKRAVKDLELLELHEMPNGADRSL